MAERKKRIRNQEDTRVSVVDKLRSTPEGLRDSNAVRATFDAIKLIEQAMTESHTSRDELAEKLEVSRERIDEILDVQSGNVRVTTLARILTVCGYKLNMSMKENS